MVGVFKDRSRRGVSRARTGDVTIATKVVCDKAWMAFCSVSVDGFCIVLIKSGIRGATSSLESSVVNEVIVFSACFSTYSNHQYTKSEPNPGPTHTSALRSCMPASTVGIRPASFLPIDSLRTSLILSSSLLPVPILPLSAIRPISS